MIGIVTLTMTPMTADFRIVRRTRGHTLYLVHGIWHRPIREIIEMALINPIFYVWLHYFFVFDEL